MKDVLELIRGFASKDLHELTPEDIAFLRARQSYLGDELTAKFASILKEEQPTPEAPAVPTPAKKKK